MMVMDIPNGSVISLPPSHLEEFAPVLLAPGAAPTENARNLPPDIISRIVGPAFVGYAEVVTGRPLHPVQLLGPKEAAHIAALQEACDPTEWEHGGSSLEVADVVCGVFAGETLAALAGYEIWDGTVAHISIITHPEHRGLGYGRSSVAFLARHAEWKQLLPQYRTLEDNVPSIAIARALGFEHFGTSVAVRLK
jgi:GNAT superfamily N-acetyltransferase